MIEWKKVKKLMDCFPESVINHNGERKRVFLT